EARSGDDFGRDVDGLIDRFINGLGRLLLSGRWVGRIERRDQRAAVERLAAVAPHERTLRLVVEELLTGRAAVVRHGQIVGIRRIALKRKWAPLGGLSVLSRAAARASRRAAA